MIINKEVIIIVIYHNANAMNANRNMSLNTYASGKSMEKLSSGLRINRAADDAAGLSMSEKMRSQIVELNQNSRNAQDALSMVQTAEGGLTEVSAMLLRMKELAVQKQNTGTYSSKDIANTDLEMNSLGTEITNIYTTTNFNGHIALYGGITASSGDNSTVIDGYIDTVNAQRANFGASQNSIEHAYNSICVTAENMQASESRIRDVDMAKEIVSFTKSNILSQAAQAMITQANQQPQQVLNLLR